MTFKFWIKKEKTEEYLNYSNIFIEYLNVCKVYNLCFTEVNLKSKIYINHHSFLIRGRRRRENFLELFSRGNLQERVLTEVKISSFLIRRDKNKDFLQTTSLIVGFKYF